MWWEDKPLEGKSILVLENAPGECSDCRLQSIEGEFSDDGLTWSTRAYCTARTEADICPLRKVLTIDEVIRPLSKEKYIKIIAE